MITTATELLGPDYSGKLLRLALLGSLEKSVPHLDFVGSTVTFLVTLLLGAESEAEGQTTGHATADDSPRGLE